MTNEQKTDYRLIVDWQEIENRPQFKLSYHFENDEDARGKLKNLIAEYHFKVNVKCGISCCGKNHQYGYLSNLVDGTEIIIGNKCGKKYFGVEFTTQRKMMNLKRRDFERFKILEEAFNKVTFMKNEVEAILINSGKYSFYYLTQAIKTLTESNNTIDYWMIKTIKEKISPNGSIYEEIFKTKQEVDTERESKTNPNQSHNEVYINPIKVVVVENIDSFEIVYKWYEAQKLKKYFDDLFTKIRPPLEMLEIDRKILIRSLREYKNNLHELKNYCDSGNRLFKSSNLLRAKRVFRDNSHKLTWENGVTRLRIK